LPKERKVKERVANFLKEGGYIVVEEPFNVGTMPDLVAFKWIDSYQVEALAVECKGSKGSVLPAKSVIDFATDQARKYQACFPYVYLATPPVSKSAEGGAVRALEQLRGPRRSGLERPEKARLMKRYVRGAGGSSPTWRFKRRANRRATWQSTTRATRGLGGVRKCYLGPKAYRYVEKLQHLHSIDSLLEGSLAVDLCL